MPDVSGVSTTLYTASLASPAAIASSPCPKMGFWARVGNVADAALQAQAIFLVRSAGLARAGVNEHIKEIEVVAAHVLQDDPAQADKDFSDAHADTVQAAVDMGADSERAAENFIDAVKSVPSP